MYVCKNCGQRFSAQPAFCDSCGSSMIEPAADYSYSSADIHVAPTRPGGKPQSIVSMILGIESIFGGLISVLYAFMTMIVYEENYGFYSPYDVGYNYVSPAVKTFALITFMCAITHLILGIVAIVLGCIARAKGSRSGMAGVGKALGIIAVILSTLSFIITISCLGMI